MAGIEANNVWNTRASDYHGMHLRQFLLACCPNLQDILRYSFRIYFQIKYFIFNAKEMLLYEYIDEL